MANWLKNSGHIFYRKQNNIISAAMVLMVLIFISSCLGLIRNRLLAGAFFSGQERLLDVYFAAFRLPDMIYQILIMGGLSAAFIPVFSAYLQHDQPKAFLTASITINLTLSIFVLLAAGVFIFARPLCGLLAPGFSPSELKIMVHLTRWLLLAQAFFVLSSLLTGILQSLERFLLPALSAVLYNLGIIAGILFLSRQFSIYGVVIGVVVGAALHFAVQLPLTVRLGFRYSWSFNWREPGVKQIFRLMGPRLLTLVVTQINLSVTTVMATALSAGTLALYSFSQNIIALPVSLFGLTIGQASLPALAREATRDRARFCQLFWQLFTQVLYLSLPASLILVVLRIPLVRLALGAKNFPWEATILAGKMVAVLALSLAFQSMIQLLIRFFYAEQDTKTPLWISVIAAVINIVLAWWMVFVLKWEGLGLCVAFSLAGVVQGIMLAGAVRHRLRSWLTDASVLYLGKILAANLLLGLALWILMRVLDLVLDTTKTINLLVLTALTLIVSLLLYTWLSRLFRIQEFDRLWSAIQKFGRWRTIFSQTDEILESPTAYD